MCDHCRDTSVRPITEEWLNKRVVVNALDKECQGMHGVVTEVTHYNTLWVKLDDDDEDEHEYFPAELDDEEDGRRA